LLEIVETQASSHPATVPFATNPPLSPTNSLSSSSGSGPTSIVSPVPSAAAGRGRGRPRGGRSATASPIPTAASPTLSGGGMPLNPNLAISPIAPVGGVAVPPVAPATTSHWSDEEKQRFLEYLAKYGKDWKTLSELIPTKSMNQIKNFFQNYRVKLKLEDLIPENPLPPPNSTGIAPIAIVAPSTRGRGGARGGRRGRPRGRAAVRGGGESSRTLTGYGKLLLPPPLLELEMSKLNDLL